MASVSVCISLQILLSCLCWALGPVSDYKSCGDPACASMMSRVQALRDHRAQDCRFLSFKKGDMIVVYYKLSGKRSDLWAGSIDTRSGLFPKDAVKIDEVFVDEEKEINVPTQKYDFYCTEEFDSIESDSSENHEDRAEQNEESGELGNSDSEAPVSKPTETNDDIQTEDTSQTAAQEPSKQDLEEPKKSGSSWIGSAVNGWFGGGEESHDEAAEESRDEESFRSRKLALDPEENRLRVETQAETTGWIGDVTNVFGFGQKVLKDSSKDLPEDIVGKEQDSPSTRSGWLGMGINDVLGFGAGDTSVKSEVKAENGDINPKSEESIEASQSLDGTEASENDKTDIKQGEDNEASSSAEESVDHEAESEDVSEKQSSGWYGNVYNRISSFYGDPQDKTDVSKEDGSGSSSEADFQPPTQSTEGDESQVTNTKQSIFSVNHISTVFDSLKSQFQSETVENEVLKEGKKPPDAGREGFVDGQNSNYEESSGDDEIRPSAADQISEIQSLSDGKHTLEVSSSSDDVIKTEDSSKECHMLIDHLQDKKEAEIPEEQSDDDVIQIKVDEETSKGQKGQIGVNSDEKGADMFGENDSDGQSEDVEVSENPTENSFPGENPTVVDLLEVDSESDTELDVNGDHSPSKLSTDRTEGIQSGVNNNDEAGALSLTQPLEGEHLGDNISRGSDNITVNTDSETKTAVDTHLDVLEASQSENVKSEDDKVEVADSYKNGANSNDVNRDGNPHKKRFISYFDFFTAQKDTKPETDSATVWENIDKESLDAKDEEILLETKTNQFSSDPDYRSTNANEEPTQYEHDSDFNTISDRDENNLDKTEEGQERDGLIFGSDTEHMELEGDKENVEIAEENEHPNIAHSSERVKIKLEGTHVNDPDDKEQYGKDEKLEDDVLIQTENQLKLSQEKTSSKRSSDKEQYNNANSANEENSDQVIPQITPKDVSVSLENANQMLFDHEKTIQKASKDVKTLVGERNDNASFAKPSQDSTEDITVSEESGFLSENEKQNGFVHEEPIKSASNDAQTLGGEVLDRVSLAKDAKTDNTDDLTTSEESGLLSETDNQEFELQNTSEDAHTHDEGHGHVSLNANTDHTALDITQDVAEDLITSEENDFPSGKANQNGFEIQEPIKKASEDANTLDREKIDYASSAKPSLDSAEDLNTTEKNRFLTENEKEFTIQNTSKEANTLEGEQSNQSLAKDANTDFTAFNISQNRTEDSTAVEKSFPSATRDDNTLDSDERTQRKVKSIISKMNEKEINGQKLDDVVEDVLRVSQRREVTKSEEKEASVDAPAEEPQNSGKYLSLEAHLSYEDIKQLLDIFGGHRLSWLDQILGNYKNTGSGPSQDNEDVSRLKDFEQTLEYHVKKRSRSGEYESSPLDEAYAKVDALLSALREKLTPVRSDSSVYKSSDLSQKECGDEGCVRLHEENPSVDEQNLVNDSSESSDSEDISDDDPLEGTQSLNGDTTNSDRITTSEKTQIRSEETALTEESVEPGETQNEGDLYQYAAFFGEMTSHTFTFVLTESAHLRDVVFEVVSSLPEDLRPGPDLYGFPWELVLFSALCGSFIFLLFSCRFISSIKGRLYASKEKRMGQKVAELLEEKCKVLETLSECKHKFEMLETSLQNGGVSAQASERQNLEVMSKKLEQSNAEMKSDIERLQEELENQSKFRKQQEEQLAGLEETLQNLEEEAKTNKTQLEQDKTTLKIHDMNSERLQKKLQAAKEENVMLIESKAQLVQESEGWAERLSELEEEMRMCERSHCGMVEDCTNKDERIKSLTECLLKMKDWDSEEESSDAAGSENGEPSDLHQKQKVQKLISAAKMCADLKAMEEDKDRVFAKLSDEVKAKEDLREGIEQLEMEKESLDTESSFYSGEIQKLQQKLQIMTEMYQENELKLHRMLTVEERERSQKEEKLSKAGKKISLAAEELNTYRQRAKELEEELERTNQAYKNQVASHEKKAHDNWLAARAADRDLADLKRENTLLRQRLTDYQFKLELMEKEPYPRESLVRPVFRGERSPFGPSPLGRPSSETRAFLSPPTLMDGPPRISPQFPMVPGGRVSRGVVEPPAGGVESDRSGALSDSGSVSPSWERERRGFGVSPGGPPPDAGIPYRRPPPGPFPLGPPASRPLPPDTYYGDKSDVLSQGNTSGLAENEGRESLQSMTGDVRAPPEMDMRMGPPPAGPPMGLPPPLDPRDPHFPRRLPYGPPDFYPLRGPAGSPLMRGPHPPGMFPRPPLPHPMAYPAMRPPPDAFLHGPPLRPPPADSFHPGPPPRPSPPGSEQPPEQPPSPHQNI